MECQKIINFLDGTPKKPSKYKTKILLEINDESRGKYKKIVKLDLKLQC